MGGKTLHSTWHVLDTQMLALPYFFCLQTARSSSLTTISLIVTCYLEIHIDEAGVAGFLHTFSWREGPYRSDDTSEGKSIPWEGEGLLGLGS
jgi:hypothetical protein